MISAKQFKVILDRAFRGDAILNFNPPTAIFTITPSTYDVSQAPFNLSFNVAITNNDGASISWEIKRLDNNVVVTSGSLSPTTFSLTTNIPTVAGSYSYSLTVSYRYNNIVQAPITKVATVLVSAQAYVGQLANAGADINNVSQVDNTLLGTLTTKNFEGVANLFALPLTRVAKVIFVVPMSYGTVALLADENDNNVLDQFTLRTDNANSRYIYVSNNALSGGVGVTQLYKFTFN
jgi:hypothetical protein